MTEKIVVEVVDNGSINQLNKEAQTLNSTLKESQNIAKNISAGGTKALAQARASAQPAGALAQARASVDSNTSRGIGGQTGAAGRDFAAQAQGLGGLVHVYATFAANLFAVSAAFTALSKAADFTNMVKGLDQLGASSGRALGSLAKRMTEVADGAISMRAAAEATAQASAGGLSGDQLLRLTNIAKTASQALGRDMTDALTRLTKGVIKIEPELLDELGIMVRVDTAAQNYARTLGKTAASLSEFEKRQSFAIAVLEQGEKKFNSIKLDANPYGKLLASLTNLALAGGEVINKFLTPIASLLATSPTALMTVMTAITALLVSKAIPALGQWRDGLLKNAQVASEIAKQTAARSQEFNLMKDAEDYHRNIKPIQDNIKSANVGILSALRTGKAELSDSLQKQFSTLDAKPMKAGFIEVTRAIQDTKGKLQELHNESFKGSISKSEMPIHKANLKAIEETTEKLKVQEQVYANMRTSAKEHAKLLVAQNAPDSKIGFSENVANRLAERSMQNFKKAQILSDVGQNTQIMGFSDAFRNMQEDIKKADLGKVSGFFTTIKGTAAIAASSIMSVASAFSTAFGVIGLVVTAGALLFNFFDKTSKESSDFSTSLDTLKSATDGVHRTMVMLEEQDPLAKFSVEGVQARANALNEVNSSLKSMLVTFKELSKATDKSFFNKELNIIKSTWGGDFQTIMSENISKGFIAAFEAARTGPAKDAAENSFRSLLGLEKTVELTDKVIEDATKAKGLTIQDSTNLIKVIDTLNTATGNAASNSSSFSTSLVQLKKDYDNFANSSLPQDALSKFGVSQMNTALDMSKGLQNTGDSLRDLAKLSQSPELLALFPPAVAAQIKDASVQLNGLSNGYILAQDSVDKYKKQVISLRGEEAALTKILDKRATQNNTLAFDQGAQDKSDTEAKKKELATKRRQIDEAEGYVSTFTTSLNTMKLKANDIFPMEKIAKLANDTFAAGVNYLSQALNTAGQQAGVTLAKAAAAGMSGVGTAELNQSIQLQEVQIQRSVIESNRGLATQTQLNTIETAKLTATMSKVAAEATLAAGKKEGWFGGDSRMVEATERLKNADKSLRSIELAKGAASVITSSPLKGKETLKNLQVADTDAAKMVTTLYQQSVHFATQLVGLAGQESAIKLTGAIQKKLEDEGEIQRVSKIRDTQIDTQMKLNDQLQSSSMFYDNILGAQQESLLQEKLALGLAEKIRALDNAKVIGQGRINALSGNQKALAEKNFAKEVSAAESAITQERINNQISGDAKHLQNLKLQLDSEVKKLNIANSYLASEVELDNLQRAKNLNNLETANTLYTLNASVYTAAKFQIEQEKLAAEYKVSQAKVEEEFFKTMADANMAYETKLAAAKALNTEEQKKAGIKAAEDEFEVRGALAAKSYSLAAGKASGTLDNGSTAAENAKKIADENARTTELMKTQESLAESLTNIFGEMGTAIGGMTKSLISFSETQNKLDKGRADQLSKTKDPVEEFKIKDKYAKESAKNEITGIANIAGASKKLFNEKSASYKIMEGVEKAAHVAKMVMAGLEIAVEVKKAMAKMFVTQVDVASIAPAVAGSAAKGAAAAAEAVPNTAAGFSKIVKDLGWPGLLVGAGFLAIMASLGSGGSSSVPSMPAGITAEDRQKVQGTGQSYVNGKLVDNGLGVYGDSTAKSKSLANSIEIMKNNSIEGLDYDNKILKAMERVADAVAGAAKSLYSIPGLRQGTNFGTLEGSSKEGGALSSIPVIGKLFGSLFGGDTSTTVSIVDAGIELAGTFKDLMNGLGKIDQYKMVRTVSDTSGGWFGSDEHSDSTEKQLNTVNSAASKAISQIFIQSADLFNKIGKEVGITAKEVDNTLSIMDAGVMVSLKDLKGQDLLDEFNAVINSKLDETASILFKSMDKYREFGEGFLETTTRVVKGNQSVNQAMLSMGAAFDVTKDKVTGGTQVVKKEIIDTVGHWEDKITHTKGKLIAGGANVDDSNSSFPSFATYYEDIVTTTKVLVGFASHFVEVVEPIVEMSKFDISESMIKNAGSLDNFMKQAETFTSNFLSESEKLKPIQKSVTDRLKDLGLSSVQTRDDFKNVVQGLNLSTVAGRDLYQSLMELAPGFAQVTSKYEEYAKTYKNSEVELLVAQGKTLRAKELQRRIDIEGLDASTIALYDSSKAREQEIKLLQDFKSLIEVNLGGVTTAIKAGLLGTQDAQQVGAALSDVIVGGIYNSFVSDGANQITKLVNDSLIQPMIDSALNGATVSEILKLVSTSTLDAVVAKAVDVATTLSAVFSNKEFVEAMGKIKVAMAEVGKSVTTGVSDLTESSNAAASSLSKLRSMQLEATNLEIQLLNAQGRTAEAKSAQSALDTKEMTNEQKAVYALISARKAEIDMTNKLTTANTNFITSGIALLNAQGKTAEALAAQRTLDTKSMSSTEIAIYDATAARKAEIEQLNIRKGLLDQFNQLTMTENQLRTIQLDKLTGINKVIQEQINIVTDAKKSNDLTKSLSGEITSLIGKEVKHTRENIDDFNLSLVNMIGYLTQSKKELDQVNSLAGEIFSITGKTFKHSRDGIYGLNLELVDLIDNLNAAKTNVDKTGTALSKALSEYQTAVNAEFDAQTKAQQEALDNLGDYINTVVKAGDKLRNVVNLLRGALDNLKIEGSQLLNRQSAQGDLASMLAQARQNPKTFLPDEKLLSKALSTVAEPSMELFATFQDYQRDFFKTANDIADLSAITDAQAVVHDTELSVAKASLDALTKAKDATLKAAQDAYDLATGVINTPGTVQSKLDAFNAATAAHNLAVRTFNDLKTVADAVAVDHQVAATKTVADAVVVASDLITKATTDNATKLSDTIIATSNIVSSQKAIDDARIKAEDDARTNLIIAAISQAGALTAAASADAAAKALQAIATANQAVSLAQSAMAAASSSTATSAPVAPVTTTTAVTDIYSNPAYLAGVRDQLNSIYSAGGSNAEMDIYNGAKNAHITLSQVDNMLGFSAGSASAWAIAHNLPTFAMGGEHAGGLRLVGEKGPELEATGAARLYNAKQTQEMFSNEALLKEMKALREEVAMLRASSDQTAANTKSSKDTLIRVTQDGQAMQVNQI